MTIPGNVLEMECDVFIDRVASRGEVEKRIAAHEANPSDLNWLRIKVAADSYNQARYWDWLEARETALAEAMP